MLTLLEQVKIAECLENNTRNCDAIPHLVPFLQINKKKTRGNDITTINIWKKSEAHFFFIMLFEQFKKTTIHISLL